MSIKSWMRREQAFIWIASLILLFGLLLGTVAAYVAPLSG
jgi:hypothetical protein